MDDEMLVFDMFWLNKSCKGFVNLDFMFIIGGGVRFIDSCDGNNVVSL